MQASKLCVLLKYAQIECQGGDDYTLFSEQDDEFYFNFNIKDGEINNFGNCNLRDHQLMKVQHHIYKWCDDQKAEQKKLKEESLDYEPDEVHGLYSYGY